MVMEETIRVEDQEKLLLQQESRVHTTDRPVTGSESWPPDEGGLDTGQIYVDLLVVRGGGRREERETGQVSGGQPGEWEFRECRTGAGTSCSLGGSWSLVRP